MCGIIGYIGSKEAWPIVYSGLQQLEYRGYDSAGIALVNSNGIEVHKSAGKVRDLAPEGGQVWPQGRLGIGHTRWATHGKPSHSNAHPHTDCNGAVAVVHNGIVENYLDLKNDLIAKDHVFTSETDSEVIPHLIEEGMKSDLSFLDAFLWAGSQLEGSQAIVSACNNGHERQLLALRLGNAGGITVGVRPGEAMVSSDLQGMVSFTERVTFLEDGETAIVTEDTVRFLDKAGHVVDKAPLLIAPASGVADKGGYRHYMLKEIMEQPTAAAGSMRERIDFANNRVVLPGFHLTDDEVKSLNRVVLLGCGTSLHAGMVGQCLIEELTGLPAEVDSSSEYRYRNFHMDDRTLVVAITQSGETADTLAAMSAVRERGGRLVALSNIEGSQATRTAESTLYLGCGTEIGVASTKTFMSSLVTLTLLSLYLGQLRGHLDTHHIEEAVKSLARIPNLVGRIIGNQDVYERLARKLYQRERFFYLGRGITYPIALEGALKLKEISYIHAEGYAAGEMKHGPIALIDQTMPVVAIAPRGPTYSKMAGNIKEARTRDGMVIAIATEGDEELASEVDEVLYIPPCPETLTPILAVAPLQLLAYHIAIKRGCDVDQPRNLAKSVTVE